MHETAELPSAATAAECSTLLETAAELSLVARGLQDEIERERRLPPLLVEQLTAPVRFTHAGQALIKEGVQTFVEVGPGNVLSGLIKRIDRNVKTISVSTPESLDKLEETLSSA